MQRLLYAFLLCITLVAGIAYSQPEHRRDNQQQQQPINRQLLVDQLVQLLQSNDPQLMSLLQARGLQISTTLVPATQAVPVQQNVVGNTNFARVTLMRSLASRQTATSWQDLKDSLARNGITLEDDDLYRLHTQSDSKCRELTNMSDALGFYRCKFQMMATFAYFRDDQAQCKRDVDATYNQAYSPEDLQRGYYLCLRNLGWKDPGDWASNLDLR